MAIKPNGKNNYVGNYGKGSIQYSMLVERAKKKFGTKGCFFAMHIFRT